MVECCAGRGCLCMAQASLLIGITRQTYQPFGLDAIMTHQQCYRAMWTLWLHRYLLMHHLRYDQHCQCHCFLLCCKQLFRLPMFAESQSPSLPSLQVNAHAAAHGIQYGMISNILWSWAFVMDGRNNMQISQPLRYDAAYPTVLQVGLYKPKHWDVSVHTTQLQLCLMHCCSSKLLSLCRFMHGSLPCL